MKLTKRLKIAVLCCLTACALALSAGFSLKSGTVKADEGESSATQTVAATSLFTLTTTGAATYEKLTHGTYRGNAGVYMGPEYQSSGAWGADQGNWSVAFSGFFKGDLKLEYTLPNAYANTWGIVEFTVCDKNGTEVFRVGRSKWSDATDKIGGMAYVFDSLNNVYYTINATSGTQMNSNDSSDSFSTGRPWAFGFYPYGDQATTDNKVGELVFAWNGNNIDVKLSRLEKPNSDNLKVSLCTVATIDGSSLKDGYTIKVGNSKKIGNTAYSSDYMPNFWGSSSNGTGTLSDTGVLITSINGTSFTEANLTATKDCYYTDVVYSGEVDEDGAINLMQDDEDVALPFKTSGLGLSIGNWRCGEFTKNVTLSYTPSEAGLNTLTWIENGGAFKKDFKINVTPAVRGSVDSTSLFEVVNIDGATTKPTIVYGEYNSNSGVRLGPTAAGYFKWETAFKGVFTGDLELEYSLVNFYSNWEFPIIEFTVCDTNGNEIFKVGRGISYNSNKTSDDQVNKSGNAYVYDVASKIYYTVKNNGTVVNSNDDSSFFGSAMQVDALGFYPFVRNQRGSTDVGTLALVLNNEGKVEVKLSRLNTPTDPTSGLSLCTVATLDCADLLTKGYKIKVGRRADNTKIWGASMSNGELIATTAVLITSVNGVSFANETVKTNKVADTISYSGDLEEDESIKVALGKNLNKFNVSGNEVIGGWQIGAFEDTVTPETFSGKEAGEYDLTVSYGTKSASYKVTVEDEVADVVNGVNLTIKKGASIRLNQSGNGIRFTMNISAEDVANLENEGTATYGMLIMPYDYLTTCGDLTVENIFGENALYAWGDGVAANRVKIIGCEDELTYSADGWYMNISIVNVLESNLNRKFIAAGYVKLTAESGRTYYKLAVYENDGSETADGTAEKAARSMYEVANAAYNDSSSTLSEDQKAALKNDYIDKVDNGSYTTYTVEYYLDGETSPSASVQISAKVDESVYVPAIIVSESGVPARGFEGYVFDRDNASNVLYGTVSENGALTLKVYYKADDAE